MSERFRFDQRLYVPVALPGLEVVKVFGLPFPVSAALPDECRMSSGLTERQVREVAQRIRDICVDTLSKQKMKIGQGRVRNELFISRR